MQPLPGVDDGSVPEGRRYGGRRTHLAAAELGWRRPAALDLRGQWRTQRPVPAALNSLARPARP